MQPQRSTQEQLGAETGVPALPARWGGRGGEAGLIDVFWWILALSCVYCLVFVCISTSFFFFFSSLVSEQVEPMTVTRAVHVLQHTCLKRHSQEVFLWRDAVVFTAMKIKTKGQNSLFSSVTMATAWCFICLSNGKHMFFYRIYSDQTHLVHLKWTRSRFPQ